jgi:hypothetical protein
MASDISKEERERMEQFIREHPFDPNERFDVFDDDRLGHDHAAGAAHLLQLLLDGKIKNRKPKKE